MAEVPPSDGDLPVDPLFGDWLNGSPAKGGPTSGGSGAESSRFMDAVLGSGADTPAGPPAPESTPFSEAVFGDAVHAGQPADSAGAPNGLPADADSPFGAAVIGDGAVGQRRLTRPVAMAGIVTLVGAGWLGVWTGISPGARHDLGDVVRALPGGNKLAPAAQQENTTHGSTPVAAGIPSVTGGGAGSTASPSVAGLNIGRVLQPALFQAGAVSSPGKRTIARHAPSPDTVSSPGHGGITVPGAGVPTPTPPVVSTGSPGPTRPGGWGGHPTPTGDPSTSPDPSTSNPDPSTSNPDPSTSNPDPSTSNPDPSTSNPDPSTSNPDPNPDPSTSIPDPIPDPDPTTSDSTDPEPTTTDTTEPAPTTSDTTEPAPTPSDTNSPPEPPSDPAT